MRAWKLLGGWSDDAVASHLSDIQGRRLNFGDAADEMVAARGWNHVESHALIAREKPGPPHAGGAFERAREAVLRFDFSDPRIVTGHFDPRTPLEQRHVLLELKALGLHFLCPVRVGGVRDDRDEGCTTFGYSFETLEGHIESGREWFLLTHDHDTGEVRFRIRADWRAGEFPNVWSYLGFQLIGRRYQRAWHRLAHLRLRRFVHENAPVALPDGRGIVHPGAQLPSEPIQLLATRGYGRRRVDVEEETQSLRDDRLLIAAGWGALTGARSLTPLAVLSHVEAKRRPARDAALPRWLTRRSVRSALFVLATGEWLFDKHPAAPLRTRLPLLSGRVATGALCGALLTRRGRRHPIRPVLTSAVFAFAATFGLSALRQFATRRGRLHPAVAGLIEDVAVLAGTLALGAVGSERAPTTEVRPQARTAGPMLEPTVPVQG